MATKNRGETLELTDKVNLRAVFKDTFGNYVDTDTFPQISLISPSGLVALTPTSAGVIREDVGRYLYVFTIPYNGPMGVWLDNWQATINGFGVEAQFSFVVTHTDQPAINLDGYLHLGDDPGFHYSQLAISNINKLLKGLKARLNSAGKVKSTDAYGNVVYVDCDIFTIDMLVTFLATSLTEFNQVPYLTFFTFEDTQVIDLFYEVLVQGATLYALSSMALLERGREYNITDNGLSFTPPTVSELLNTQWSTTLTAHWDKLKYIKTSLRPNPMGLGTRVLGINPQIARLKHLRERQII